MSKHPAEPHLFEVAIKNDGTPFIVRAGSLAEARNYVNDTLITTRKLGPTEAFRAGREGAEILNAKPEYAMFDEVEDDIDTDQALSAGPEVQHV